ncbi:MAG: hypothetical protein GX282_02020 [Campylobacteraceae bacterium]|nr:hypothetical protein [Campylobacteraceae bacterium]
MKKLNCFIKVIILTFIMVGSGYAYNPLPFGALPTGKEHETHKADSAMVKTIRQGSAQYASFYYYYQNTQDKHKIRWQPTEQYSGLNPYVQELKDNFIFGDFVMTGSGIIKDWQTYHNVKDLNLGSDRKQNSSMAQLAPMTGKDKYEKVGEKIEADDVVYARLYWQGMLFDKKDWYSDSDIVLRHFYDDIKNYRDITISVDGSAPQTLTAALEDTFVIYSSSKYLYSSKYGYSFEYSASVDVTEIVRANLTNGEIVVGGINTSLDSKDKYYIPNTPSNMVTGYHFIGRYRKDGGIWTNNNIYSYPARGGWSLVVVYNNKDKYKPKSVTLYDGFTNLSSRGIDGAIDSMTLDFSGFYTPKNQEFDAKAGYFLNGSSGGSTQGMRFSNKASCFTNPVGDCEVYELDGELNPIGSQLNNSMVYLDHDGKQKNITNSGRGMDLDIYNLKGKLKPEQTSASLQITVSSKYNSQYRVTHLGSALVSTVAFSTDLYVPKVCYYNVMYNRAGISSRDEGFVVTPGEPLKNHVYFALKDADAKEAYGLKVKSKLSKNIKYIENTMRIDNSLKHKGQNDFKENDLYYMKDNQKGLYKDSSYAATSLVSGTEDKQFNKYNDKTSIDFYIGKGSGDIVGGKISGGEIKAGEKVYTEYYTTIGGYYEEPKFTYDFTLEGVELPYDAPMEKCYLEGSSDDEWKNEVKVVPIDGLRVVNQNYQQRGDDDKLYTQIASEPFDVKIVYDINITDFGNEDLNTILGDDDLVEFMCKSSKNTNACKTYKNPNSGSNEKKQALDALKAEYESEKNRIIGELTQANSDLAAEEAKLPEAQEELAKAVDELAVAEEELAKAEQELSLAQAAYDSNPSSENEAALNNAKAKRNDAKNKKEDAENKKAEKETALKTIQDEITRLKTLISNLTGEQTQMETPFKDEFSERFQRLDGTFVLSLFTREEIANLAGGYDKINKDVCDEAVKDKQKNHFYKFFADFKSPTDEGGTRIGDFGEKTKLNPKKAKGHAYKSFDYFLDTEAKKNEIPINNVEIGFARKDYTFIISYLPSGVENLGMCIVKECQENSAINGNDEEMAKCRAKCEEKALEDSFVDEYKSNVCRPERTFSVRPAYFAMENNPTRIEPYVAGGKEFAGKFVDNFYPVTKKGDYVLGYDNVLLPNDDVEDNKKETIFGQLSSTACLKEPISNIYIDLTTGDVGYESNASTEDFTGKTKIWSNQENSSNNLRVSFEKGKNGETKFEKEKEEYNEITDRDSLKTKANPMKSYADFKLRNVGGLNYYNIGYAKMSVSDKSWSQDGCIDGNYTNDALSNDISTSKKGMVGCYVGIEDQNLDNLKDRIGSDIIAKLIPKDLVFKFKHSDIEININDLSNALSENGHNYTYFSDDRDMVAGLDMSSAAYFNAYINEELKEQKILATLYNKNCYARDIVFGLDFEFDCDGDSENNNISNTDSVKGTNRCKKIKVVARGDDDDDDGKTYKIADSYKEFCNLNPLHARCYRLPSDDILYSSDENNSVPDGILFFAKDGIINYDINSSLSSKDVEFPLNDKKDSVLKPLYLYTELKKDKVDDNVSSNRLPIFKFKESSFANGENVGVVGINFVRERNKALNPKIIYAEDFAKNKDIKFQEQPLVTDGKIENNEVMTSGIVSDRQNFNEYKRKLDIGGGENILETADNGVAHYYYGYINSERKSYGVGNDVTPLSLNDDHNISVYSMVYCSPEVDGKKVDCFDIKSLSLLYKENDGVNQLQVGNREYFYQNPAEFNTGNGNDKADWFDVYERNGNMVSFVKGFGQGDREPMVKEADTQRQYEKLSVKSSHGGRFNVHVNTRSWLLYNESGQTLTDGFNLFELEFSDTSTFSGEAQWGGVGRIQDADGKDTDEIVGRYLDEEGDKANKDKYINIQNKSNRITW